MSHKTGGKNRKFGRHARNPSSKLQKQRSERNKARNIAAHPKDCHGHVCPAHPAQAVVVPQATMTHAVNEAEFSGQHYLWRNGQWVHKDSRIPMQGNLRVVTKRGVSIDVVRVA